MAEEEYQMSAMYSSAIAHIVAPSLAPKTFMEILQDADALLALIGNRPLPTVAEVALTLSHSANEAGSRELAEAAIAVSRIASGHQAVALAGAIRDLAAAIARAQQEYCVTV